MEEGSANTEQGFSSVIKIADEVIISIASLAAEDIDGVAGIALSPCGRFMNMLGPKAQKKGIKAAVDGEDVKIDLSLIVDYGSNIPALSKAVQEKVSSTISNMTGFNVSEVNITIAGINLPES